jgi:hypothetical protein
MTAMLIIGNSPATIRAAADAIIDVLKAAGTENASVAAMNCLAALAKAPDHTSISSCTFTNNPPRRRK